MMPRSAKVVRWRDEHELVRVRARPADRREEGDRGEAQSEYSAPGQLGRQLALQPRHVAQVDVPLVHDDSAPGLTMAISVGTLLNP